LYIQLLVVVTKKQKQTSRAYKRATYSELFTPLKGPEKTLRY